MTGGESDGGLRGHRGNGSDLLTPVASTLAFDKGDAELAELENGQMIQFGRAEFVADGFVDVGLGQDHFDAIDETASFALGGGDLARDLGGRRDVERIGESLEGGDGGGGGENDSR